MKKEFFIGLVVAGFVFYAVFNNKSTSAATVPNSSSANSGSIATGTQTNGTYKDGTYTGSSADAFYGTIQVQATISSGKITNVQFLQYPSDNGHSIAVNQQADPLLAQEAIQAQSSNVNIVSGATDSSQAFQQSLADALSQAK